MGTPLHFRQGINGPKRYLDSIFHGYAGIFFLRSHWVGVLLFAVSLFKPNIGLAGVIAIVATRAFGRLINVDRAFWQNDCYTYNPLLVGLAIGFLFKLTPLTISFLVISALLTFILTTVMFSISSYYLKLPILSLPFVFATWLAYFASPAYPHLPWIGFTAPPVSWLEAYLPFWLSGYCKALGAIFFLPEVAPGLLLALVILGASRILFLLSIAGYLTGSLVTAWLVGSLAPAFSNINNFNFILIAIAVGGIFLIPSLQSLVLAMLAVATSTVVLNATQVFCGLYKIPVLTLPFNLVTLSFLYVLGLLKYPQVAKLIKSSPEETLDFYLANRQRFRWSQRTLALPFSGKWTVWQGFEGDWTHQDKWKYAYDFIITDAQGRSYRDAGKKLTDYYSFGKPVLSPVSGKVHKLVNSLPDNPIGQIDKINNWGNHLIIRDERGFFVEISHFAEGSIKVKEGDQLERGAFLGLCGNSGYSPQPHIHIQVQECGLLGSVTLPFSFVNYTENNHYHSNGSPEVDAQVESLLGERNIKDQTTFKVGEVYQYEVWQDGRKIDELSLIVKMALDGTYYFESGKGKLYFGKSDETFYFYSVEGKDPYLETILLALPRFPLAFRPQLLWCDYLPVGLVTSGLTKAAAQFVSLLSPKLLQNQIELSCVSQDKFAGTVRVPALKLEKKISVDWDDHVGFRTLTVDGLELRRPAGSGLAKESMGDIVKLKVMTGKS
ncbi:MAG: urea transporter [Deltaproteobacteria bacterium]|nr:urea transporter [Deltaproteobacteria bacterium]